MKYNVYISINTIYSARSNDRTYHAKNVIRNILHLHRAAKCGRMIYHFKLITFSLSRWTRDTRKCIHPTKRFVEFFTKISARAVILFDYFGFSVIYFCTNRILSLSVFLRFSLLRIGRFSRISIFKCNEVLAFFVFRETAVREMRYNRKYLPHLP